MGSCLSKKETKTNKYQKPNIKSIFLVEGPFSTDPNTPDISYKEVSETPNILAYEKGIPICNFNSVMKTRIKQIPQEFDKIYNLVNTNDHKRRMNIKNREKDRYGLVGANFA